MGANGHPEYGIRKQDVRLGTARVKQEASDSGNYLGFRGGLPPETRGELLLNERHKGYSRHKAMTAKATNRRLHR